MRARDMGLRTHGLDMDEMGAAWNAVAAVHAGYRLAGAVRTEMPLSRAPRPVQRPVCAAAVIGANTCCEA